MKRNLLGLAPKLTEQDYVWIKFYAWGWRTDLGFWKNKTNQDVWFLNVEEVITQSERSRKLWVSLGEDSLSKKLYAYAKQQGLSAGSPAKAEQS